LQHARFLEAAPEGELLRRNLLCDSDHGEAVMLPRCRHGAEHGEKLDGIVL